MGIMVLVVDNMWSRNSNKTYWRWWHLKIYIYRLKYRKLEMRQWVFSYVTLLSCWFKICSSKGFDWITLGTRTRHIEVEAQWSNLNLGWLERITYLDVIKNCNFSLPFFFLFFPIHSLIRCINFKSLKNRSKTCLFFSCFEVTYKLSIHGYL